MLATLVLVVVVIVATGLVAMLGVYRWRMLRFHRWLLQQLRSGAWVVETCATCRGRGICPQCGGMGTLGLMGKPCPACGGGERIEGGREITLRGSGRCAVCGGRGQVYRDRVSGETIAMSDEDVEMWRGR